MLFAFAGQSPKVKPERSDVNKSARRSAIRKTIRVCQSSEFVSRDLDLWAYANRVTLVFSRPGANVSSTHAATSSAARVSR